jgi:hypothetical protein
MLEEDQRGVSMSSSFPMDYPNEAVNGILDHRYSGLDGQGFTQGPGGVRRNQSMQGCTDRCCYGTEGGQGTGSTGLPQQGAAQAMLSHRYGSY